MFAIKPVWIWHYTKTEATSKDFKLDIDWRQHYLRHKYYLALERIENLLTGKELGFWGAKDKETLAQYEKIENFSFQEFYSTNRSHYYWLNNTWSQDRGKSFTQEG
jgi:hypothetical protein